jgi:hypothetical protein
MYSNIRAGVFDCKNNKIEKSYLWFAYDIQQLDDIWSAIQILQNLNFSLNFLLLDRLKHFNYAFLIGFRVDALENL